MTSLVPICSKVAKPKRHLFGGGPHQNTRTFSTCAHQKSVILKWANEAATPLSKVVALASHNVGLCKSRAVVMSPPPAPENCTHGTMPLYAFTVHWGPQKAGYKTRALICSDGSEKHIMHLFVYSAI